MPAPRPPGPTRDLACCKNVSSMVLFTAHMFADMNDLATLFVPNLSNSAVSG